MTTATPHRTRRDPQPLALLGYLLAVTTVAGLGGLASSVGVEGWYAQADRPFFTPPNWLFAPVWTALYAAMALSAWLLRRHGSTGWSRRRSVLRLWWAQLVLNLAWTPVFFALQLLWLGLAVIVVLDLVVAALVVRAWRTSRPAGALLSPYLAWICYATALNLGVAALN